MYTTNKCNIFSKYSIYNFKLEIALLYAIKCSRKILEIQSNLWFKLYCALKYLSTLINRRYTKPVIMKSII